MNKDHREAGFTIIETLVAIALFAIVSTAFYSLLFSGARSSQQTVDIADVAQEARMGLNRMIRDTREGQLFSSFSPDSYNVRIDFDGDFVYENPNEDGDYENLTYRYVPAGANDPGKILLNNQLLVEGVEPIPGREVFYYTSSDLRYDWNRDGVTTPGELDVAPSKGYASVDSSRIDLYQNVRFAFQIGPDGEETQFVGQAQLRNHR